MFIPALVRSELVRSACCRQFQSRSPLGFGKVQPEDIENPDPSSVFDEPSTPVTSLFHRNAGLPQILGGPCDRATHQRTNPRIVRSLLQSRRETARSRLADS